MSSPCGYDTYAVLAIVSNSYPPVKARLLMYYSPVRHSSPKWSVRLACIRHAASVHPEPGSNSPLSYFFQTTLVFLALFYFFNLIDVVFYSFLFSFQCPLTWLSRRVPFYITIPSPFCKAFSLSFFIFFSLSLFFCLYINVFLSVFFCHD